jgi:hypothetical protein
MRFYLDEMLSPIIAQIVRWSGVDIVSAVEIGRTGTPDEIHLRYAAAEGRCIVTKNYDDFHALTGRFQATGEPHAGVALVPKSMLSEDFAAIAASLVGLARLYPDGLPPYSIVWLTPPNR